MRSIEFIHNEHEGSVTLSLVHFFSENFLIGVFPFLLKLVIAFLTVLTSQFIFSEIYFESSFSEDKSKIFALSRLNESLDFVNFLRVSYSSCVRSLTKMEAFDFLGFSNFLVL
ncbi:hypothetical protein METP2_02812 [Methanosarcinales archaeon]|nr:hypothetical protein METP2_02812 [Methanosarcinales archaeon]